MSTKPPLSPEVADERARCVAIIRFLRERGDTDMRTARDLIADGTTVKELTDEQD